MEERRGATTRGARRPRLTSDNVRHFLHIGTASGGRLLRPHRNIYGRRRLHRHTETLRSEPKLLGAHGAPLNTEHSGRGPAELISTRRHGCDVDRSDFPLLSRLASRSRSNCTNDVVIGVPRGMGAWISEGKILFLVILGFQEGKVSALSEVFSKIYRRIS